MQPSNKNMGLARTTMRGRGAAEPSQAKHDGFNLFLKQNLNFYAFAQVWHIVSDVILGCWLILLGRNSTQPKVGNIRILQPFHSIFFIYVKSVKISTVGDCFNQFFVALWSFWYIICLNSWKRSYLPPTIYLVTGHSNWCHSSLSSIIPAFAFSQAISGTFL